MIVFRALQGMLGASMIPTVFTSSFHYFQGQRRVYSAAVVGTIASVAPTLGPVIGGWITDTLDWRWLFYVNLVPGLIVAVTVSLLVKIDHPDLSLLKGADYLGMILLALTLGTLEYVLEEGARWNWFDDFTITACAWIAGISRCALRHPQLYVSAPGRRSARVRQSQFLARLLSVLRHRHRHLLDDLSDAAVPRLCARVQRVADRRRRSFRPARLTDRRSGLCDCLSRKIDTRWLMMFGLASFAAAMWSFSFIDP